MKKSDLRSQAVMNVDKGESIEGLWVTPQIPQIGVYKLVVKRRTDGILRVGSFSTPIGRHEEGPVPRRIGDKGPHRGRS